MLFKRMVPEALSSEIVHREYLRGWSTESAILTEFTPDLAKLEKYQYLNLFVYGDLMEGQGNHWLMKDKSVERRAVAYTQDEYCMLKRDLGDESYPYAYQRRSDKDRNKALRIRGEWYQVRPYRFVEIDNHMRNTVQFMRKRVNVVVPHRAHNQYEERLTVVRCWMHVGVKSYFDDLEYWMTQPVKSYSDKKERPWMKDYYYFSRTECLPTKE